MLATFREEVTSHISPRVPKIQFRKNSPKLGHWESHLGCPGLCCGLDGHLTTDPLTEVVSAARSQAGCTRSVLPSCRVKIGIAAAVVAVLVGADPMQRTLHGAGEEVSVGEVRV